MTEIEITGCNMTCPELTWGWEVAAYLFLGGLVGGLMIVGAMLRLRRGEVFAPRIRVADFFALPLLGVGLFFLFLDLANRWNAWRFFTTFQVSSPMSWGSWILLVAGIVLTARVAVHLGLGGVSAWDGRHAAFRIPLQAAARVGQRLGGTVRDLDIASVVVGAALAFYTGMLLSTIPARPLWDSFALAPLFLVSGMTAAAAFYCLGAAEPLKRTLAPGTLSLCAIELGLIGVFLISMASVSEAGRGRELLLEGGFGAGFWLIVVGLGVLAPAAIEGLELARRKVPALLGKVAPYLKLTGSAALRFIVVAAGLQSFV